MQQDFFFKCIKRGPRPKSRTGSGKQIVHIINSGIIINNTTGAEQKHLRAAGCGLHDKAITKVNEECETEAMFGIRVRLREFLNFKD